MESLNSLLNGAVLSTGLFYLFATLTLVCAALVVANPFSRNPVTSAMFLVLAIISMAGLFLLLHAFFLAAVQILVYAGAVIVLFLFVIMLLEMKEELRRRINLFGFVAGLLSVGLFVHLFLSCLHQMPSNPASAPVLEGDTSSLGKLLFTQFVLPFEVVSILLLVAMVGVIFLSSKDSKHRAAPQPHRPGSHPGEASATSASPGATVQTSQTNNPQTRH